jgi:hypothetical protein
MGMEVLGGERYICLPSLFDVMGTRESVCYVELTCTERQLRPILALVFVQSLVLFKYSI